MQQAWSAQRTQIRGLSHRLALAIPMHWLGSTHPWYTPVHPSPGTPCSRDHGCPACTLRASAQRLADSVKTVNSGHPIYRRVLKRWRDGHQIASACRIQLTLI